MTQLGESVAVSIGGGGTEKCIFCGADHQDEKPADAHKFDRDMSKLKREGRDQTCELGRAGRYPTEDKPPLVEWSKDLGSTGGYKAAAHHCVALKTASEHRISGELNEAGYDPNEGSNCIWLPYSRLQFIRARAYSKPLQKHRGGHTDQYFKTVKNHVDNVADLVAKGFCANDNKAPKEKLVRLMKTQENLLWLGVSTASIPAYQLYNTSFLRPNVPWGHYDEEKGKTKATTWGCPRRQRSWETTTPQTPRARMIRNSQTRTS